jgi:mannobiose 2-epimerase
MGMNDLVLLAAFIHLFSGCRPAPPPGGESGILRDPAAIALQMESVLDTEIEKWFPLCVDTLYGGFLSDLDYSWAPSGRQDKMIVTQARHIWSASHVAMYRRGDRPLLAAAAHGFRFLREKMWDRKYRGFYDLVTRTGEPSGRDGMIVKTAYGNAFAIYGLSAYFKASGDTAALALAREAFMWLEHHSYDSLNGGYYQFISREGEPFHDGFRGTPPKDQNSTIHLLESFTELYGVWPDPTVKDRLGSLLRLVRDRITNGKGYMNLFFLKDWTPVTYGDSDAETRAARYEIDHISFGHDVETTYLMLDASAALGHRDDPATIAVGKKKVDYALRHGWDTSRGGLYDGGFESGKDGSVAIVRDTKEWWAQAEALNTFLLMSAHYPDDTLRYFDKFCTQWAFCDRYLIDRKHGGWFWDALDTKPDARFSPKGSIWKAEYHTSRAMMNCIARLRAMAPGERRPAAR